MATKVYEEQVEPAGKAPAGEQKENEAPSEQKKDQAPDDAPAAPPDPAKKRRGLIIGGILLVLLATGAYLWWSHAQTYEETDDAQVDGHLNPVASRVAGTIKAVYVENNQRVDAGKPLVDLDPSDYTVTLAQSSADYDLARAQLKSEQPNVPITLTSNQSDLATAGQQVAAADAALAGAEQDYQTAVSELREAEANNAKAQADLVRYKQLIDKQEVAQSTYDQYAAAAKAQAATVDAQRAAVVSAAKIIDQRKAELSEQKTKEQQTVGNAPRQLSIRNANIQARKASLESSAAKVEQDKLNLSYCHITAPVSGLVTQRIAEVGARISVGQQLMVIVQTNDLWVTANFKETQLRKLRDGQRVTIKVDALERSFEGYIENMPAATGDRTSALPPENATGNYVKVVQRMPVRIRFNPNQQGLDLLRPGMAVEPRIHLQ